jgi:hypothetical protein
MFDNLIKTTIQFQQGLHMMIKKTMIAIAAAGTLLLTTGFAQAQTVTAGTTISKSANPEGARIAASFSGFAGSPENAESMVQGLRTGTSITLGPSATGPNSTAPSAGLSPATGKMGYGNVRTAISLAQASLSKEGITNPTPAQLSAALGGVLGQRAEGMGWGQIAQSMGFKLGSVMSASHTDKSSKQASKASKTDKHDTDAQSDHAAKGLAMGKSAGANGSGSNAGGNGGGKGGGNGGGNGGGGGGGGGGNGGGGNGGGKG